MGSKILFKLVFINIVTGWAFFRSVLVHRDALLHVNLLYSDSHVKFFYSAYGLGTRQGNVGNP
jgi:hypothetical protein